MDWASLQAAVRNCEKCGLCRTRTNTAFGEGNEQSDILFVGEGPGREEDLQGRPFVGPAGQLLDRMLKAIDIRREDVYIANVVKCRPPGNRNPSDEEAALCMPYLRAQFSLIRPRIIVCLGAVAMRHLYDPNGKISRDRGKWIERGGVWFMPTYHPAALLRNESLKRDAWADMQALRDKRNELNDQQGG